MQICLVLKEENEMHLETYIQWCVCVCVCKNTDNIQANQRAHISQNYG